MTDVSPLVAARNRAVIMEELRRLMPGVEDLRTALPLGLSAVDSHLPQGGLTCGGLHEVVPEAGATAAALGFMAALLARLSGTQPLIVVMPAYGRREHGRLFGHGLFAFGLDPASLILVETAHRKDTLWALEEALHSGAPAAIAGMIDELDLRSNQRLQLAATAAGLPLFLLRPAAPSRPFPAYGGGSGEGSAATTRWRVGTAEAARDRFGLVARPRWHLHLERCRNGRPGEWMVEYDHVAHRFSLAATLADPALSRRPSEKLQKNLRQAG
jgi:protein ImuA